MSPLTSFTYLATRIRLSGSERLSRFYPPPTPFFIYIGSETGWGWGMSRLARVSRSCQCALCSPQECNPPSLNIVFLAMQHYLRCHRKLMTADDTNTWHGEHAHCLSSGVSTVVILNLPVKTAPQIVLLPIDFYSKKTKQKQKPILESEN